MVRISAFIPNITALVFLTVPLHSLKPPSSLHKFTHTCQYFPNQTLQPSLQLKRGDVVVLSVDIRTTIPLIKVS